MSIEKSQKTNKSFPEVYGTVNLLIIVSEDKSFINTR